MHLAAASLEDRFARLAVLQREVVALARKTAAIDVRTFESDPPEILATRLSPRVLELLVEGRHLLAEIVRVCEPDDASPLDGDAQETPLAYLPFEQVLEHEVERVAGIGTIGDIAFLAKLEVRERLECLARIAESPKHATILAECDSSIRRLRKALVVLDQTFARAGVGEARLDYASELEISLEVRVAYAKLRTRVRAVGEPSGDTFYVQLRALGTALATVVGWKGYSNLRVRDRMQLRELQRRLLAWFRSERDEADGICIWRDLDSFVHILADVNRRQELRDHDARIVRKALAAISATMELVPPSIMSSPERLNGLDEEVDSLLESRAADNAGSWRQPLARLARELPAAEERA